MSADNKTPSVRLERKDSSTRKYPSELRRKSKKESPRRRCLARTRSPSTAAPLYAAQDRNEDSGTAWDDLALTTPQNDFPELTESRPGNRVEENKWLDLSDASQSFTTSGAFAGSSGRKSLNLQTTPEHHYEAFEGPPESIFGNSEQDINSEAIEEVIPTYCLSEENDPTFEGVCHDGENPGGLLSKTSCRIKFGSSEKLTQRAFEGMTDNRQETKRKPSWKLDQRFVLTSDFPASLSEENPRGDLQRQSVAPPHQERNEFLGGGKRSLPSLSGRSTSPAFSKSWNEAAVMSGKTCQIRLPQTFPGVFPSPSSPPPKEPQSISSDEEMGFLSLRRAKSPSPPLARAKREEHSSHKKYLGVPGHAIHPSSTRSSPGPDTSRNDKEQMAMRWASNEFLAARLASELDTVFTQTFGVDKPERSQSCVTPNLMARSSSVTNSRTCKYYPDEMESVVLPSLHGGYSKRVFVTFDKDFPRANAVNLEGKSEIAARCRRLNKRMDKPVKTTLDMKLSQVNPAQKTVMIRKWVDSCSPRGIPRRAPPALKFTVYTK